MATIFSSLARSSITKCGTIRSPIALNIVKRFSSSANELEKAKQMLNQLREDPGNDIKLKLYGLYKQATLGRCNTKQPGAFDFVGKAKWNAWNSLGNLPEEEAVKQYSELVNDLLSHTEPVPDVASSSQLTSQNLKVTNENGVLTIMLNRPQKKNALLTEMYDEIVSLLERAASDSSVKVVVTRGAGDYYSSGNDLSNFANIPPEGPQKMADEACVRLKSFVDAFINFPKPLVAAVNGPAVGITVTILGLYDFVYAADTATFHTPFTRIAQSPEGCSSYLFPRIMGSTKANEMLLLNQKLTATEAMERNLVTRIFPLSEFDQKVNEVVQYMAGLPPQSFLTSKKLMRDVARKELEEVNVRECNLLVERWLSEECAQAILSFFQRKQS